MFSGKTEALIGGYRDFYEADFNPVALKPAIDTRHPAESIVSHSGSSIPAAAISDPADLDFIPPATPLVVDEVQFLSDDLVEALVRRCDAGQSLWVAGLDRDFGRRRFETTLSFIERATSVSRLAATCTRCGASASLTQRLREGRPVPLDEPRFVVADGELYEPRCEGCWLEERMLGR